MTAPSASRYEPWLEIIDGDAPLLLIAPHGGRAGEAARATLHPKVNDLETADITREIAVRLGAPALINAAMDRNELDCNRLSQISERAPWLLELIADQIDAIIRRAGHATVLLIHGWNIIEPRIDLGLGLREAGGTLRPSPGAHVSASDAFIRGPVSLLAARLRKAHIQPTFGLRYPGGAAQNLLQGFTQRHAGSEAAPLRRLAMTASDGMLNALQLEMSVALRLPGVLRERAIGAISDTFLHNGTAPQVEVPPPLDSPVQIIRHAPPRLARSKAASSAPPSRVGVEFYDPATQVGGMVSFDFGPGAAGGRIMILFEGRRVALFTAEGKAERERNQLSIGPLTLNATSGGGLHFRGPAVIVDDGTAYLSVERALATGQLDPAAEVHATLELNGAVSSFSDLLTELDQLLADASTSPQPRALSLMIPPHAAFGRLRGTIRLNNSHRTFDGVFRMGASFTGLGPQKFVTRKMMWASFPDLTGQRAFEARALELDGQNQHSIARLLHRERWDNCSLQEIEIKLASKLKAPELLMAMATDPSGQQLSMEGKAGTFVMLSRPGPDGTRLHTSLGFAAFKLGNSSGAGMYEFSQRVGLKSISEEREESPDG